MPIVVPGFTHRAGVHCGSTAMSDALRCYGLELSEPLALGLGGGPFFLLFEGVGSPSRYFLGRTVSYEHDLCRHLGVTFDERSVASFDDAWQQLRALIDAGHPVLLLTDLKFLPHYGSSTHFNGHRVVCAGYDDARGVALLADSHFPGLVEVPVESLRLAMTSDAPPLTTTDCMFGRLEVSSAPLELRDVAVRAIRFTAANALEEGGFLGVPGIERLARRLPRWGEAADWKWCARFGYQVIEKRGNGGGLFRRMYAQFLAEASELGVTQAGPLIPLALAAAQAWTSLAAEFRATSERETPDFSDAAALAGTVAVAERRLWEAALG